MYIFDGNPNGRIMCELSNWNGRVYKISRNELPDFSQRADSENTGVYFLFGKNEENNDTVYIGEAERMFSRLKQHLKDSEYWNDCIAVISKDNLLNKAHVKYFENKFFLLAQNAGIVFSKEQIYDCVWKEPYFGDYNIVMSHIRNLREKIEDNPSKPMYIQTVWGVGYRFNKNLSSGL